MSIEKTLQDIVDALKANTTALQALAGKGEPPATQEVKTPPVSAKVKAQAKAVAAPKVEAPVEEVASGPNAADVEAKIDAMLKANKRKAAIDLLASFNGAKSKTGIIEQGAEVMAAFVEGADEILLSA
jgi:hypothetical protein